MNTTNKLLMVTHKSSRFILPYAQINCMEHLSYELSTTVQMKKLNAGHFMIKLRVLLIVKQYRRPTLNLSPGSLRILTIHSEGRLGLERKL